MGVIGPHSSGKHQLLSCLAGEWMPRGCQVSVAGRPLRESMARVTYVPPTPGIFPEMTCREFLDFFARSFRVSPHYRSYLVGEALGLVGLASRAEAQLASTTTSDRYRVSLARALVSHPTVVLVQGLLSRVESDLVPDFVEVLQRVRQTGATLVVSATSLGPLMGLCSHLCVLVTDRPLICGAVADLLPRLVHLKMMQVQFLSGLAGAMRLLERTENVYHLSVSTLTHNLVRFLYDAEKRPFSELLLELQRNGCSIVSVAEDQSFLGRWPV